MNMKIRRIISKICEFNRFFFLWLLVEHMDWIFEIAYHRPDLNISIFEHILQFTSVLCSLLMSCVHYICKGHICSEAHYTIECHVTHIELPMATRTQHVNKSVGIPSPHRKKNNSILATHNFLFLFMHSHRSQGMNTSRPNIAQALYI